MPENWVQRPVVNTEEGSNPGAPLAWGSPENPDDAVAGYGYVPCDTSEVEETFYYHSDHLGSTAYITDQKANVTQYDAYLPYGELLVDEHSSSKEMPYKFNGKELDEETGLYYYGARYMNPLTSMWYGVDPLAEKYVNIGAYIYCHGNPVKLVDPDGKDDYYDINGNFIGQNNKKTDNICIGKIVGSYYDKNGKKFNQIGNVKNIKDVELSAEILSKIYTNVLKRNGFKVDKLYNGAVSVTCMNNDNESKQVDYTVHDFYNYEYNKDVDIAEHIVSWIPYNPNTGYAESGPALALCDKINGKYRVSMHIYPLNAFEREYFSTVSNVVNMIGVHEFEGHGIKGIPSAEHYKILKLQREHGSWKTTTNSFKELYNSLERTNDEYKPHN